MRVRSAVPHAALVLGVVATLAAGEASARRSYGMTVDEYCTSNQRTPSTPFAGDCAICHDPNDSGSNRTALFSAFRSGDLDAFCPPTDNNPPQFEPVQDPMLNENELLTLDVLASDPDGDALSLEASDLPTGAVFEDLGGGTGQLVWMPSFEQAGSHSVTFRATDSGSPIESAMLTIHILVGDVNRPPALAAIGNRSTSVGATLSIALTATDPDGDDLQYGMTGLPPAAVLSDLGDGTGTLEWAPGAGDVGTHPVTISVTDSGTPMASDSEEIAISVGDGINRPPQLDPIGDRSVEEGESWSVSLGATDPDGDSLAFDCLVAPVEALLRDMGDGTAILEGQAAYDDAGNYPLTCSVTDAGTPPESDEETFVLTIGDVNRPPTLDPVSVIRQDGALFVPLTAHDPDGDALAFAVVGLPPGADFVDYGDGTAELSWLPPADLVGDFDLTFTVTDDGVPAESASRDLTLSLAAPEPTIELKQARWNPRHGLAVSGSGAPAFAIVEIFDAADGTLLGGLEASRNGRFQGLFALDAAPCVVRAATSDEQSLEIGVRRAPDACPTRDSR